MGTANFTQPYGILASNSPLGNDTILEVLKVAEAYGIDTLDTAFAYGDFSATLKNMDNLQALNIVTKFSILDDYKNLYQTIRHSITPSFSGYYALLVHDPQNLERADKRALHDLFDKLQSEGLVKKIGVSIYEEEELSNFRKHWNPELIQIPLNPLNQKFANEKFINYVFQNRIEVHARSLFLQGVLLARSLPQSLQELKPLWHSFTESCKVYGSRLNALLSWACKQQWINKWVLGISSLEDFNEILETAIHVEDNISAVNFEIFKNITHPLVNPKNWKY